MSYAKKEYHKEAPKPLETDVWSCLSHTCKGWMRAEFCLEQPPTCPLCHEGMEEEVRSLLPINYEYKYRG